MAIVMQHRFESVEQSSAPIAPRSHSRLVIENLDSGYDQGVALLGICWMVKADASGSIVSGQLAA